MTTKIVVAPIKRGLTRMKSTVAAHFTEPAMYYRQMPQPEFHAIVKQAQDDLNSHYMPHRIADALFTAISDFLETKDIVVQSNLYLRAARPYTPTDIVGWHRESFYGAPFETANVWVPVLNVTEHNTLRYIPDSEHMSEFDISVERVVDKTVPQGSDSHKIGLLYAPKHIVGGVDFGQSQPMIVPDGSAAIFPGELIHGAAVNESDDIRFSVDIRVLAAEHIAKAKEGYFIPL